MKEYTIVRKTDWDNVPELEINEMQIPFDADIKAFAKICYDDENLYVRLKAHEKDIRAVNLQSDPVNEPCEDSCLEFFFSPDNNSDLYFNIEYNPNKLRFLGIGRDIYTLMRLYPQHDDLYDFEPESEYVEDGWQITYHIPYKFVRIFFSDFRPVPGAFIRANCFTTGDCCKVPHNLAWNPIDLNVFDSFHNPKCFGIMYFA